MRENSLCYLRCRVRQLVFLYLYNRFSQELAHLVEASVFQVGPGPAATCLAKQIVHGAVVVAAGDKQTSFSMIYAAQKFAQIFQAQALLQPFPEHIELPGCRA